MDPRLYIVMRDDLPDLTGGKLLPQCAHAASAFHNAADRASYCHPDKRAAALWQSQTPQGFGTKIILSGSIVLIEELVERATQIGLFAEVVHDPSFPVGEGEERTHVPMDTCGYVFIPSRYANPLLARLSALELHP